MRRINFAIGWVSLKYKLIVFIIGISIIPLAVVGYLVNTKSSSLAVERETENALNLNNTKMNALDRSFNEIEFLLSDLVTNFNTTYYLQNINGTNYESDRAFSVVSEVGSRLDSIMTSKPGLFDAVLIIPSGDGLPFLRGTVKDAETDNFTNLPVYTNTVKTHAKALWQYMYENGAASLTVSESIVEPFSDEVLGIAVFNVNVDMLFDELDANALAKGESIQIVTANKKVIYDSDRTKIGSSIQADLRADQFWTEASGSFKQKTDEGEWVVSYRTSEVNGWKIIYRIPYANIVHGVSQISRMIVLVTMVVGCFAFAAALLLYLHLYRPIASLIKAMKRFEIGQLQERVKMNRKDEFGRLARAFNYLAERVSILIEDVTQEQKAKKEHEIRALQAQITPHFLYNTINSIKSLARMNRPKDIEAMSGALIDLLRISASHQTDLIRIQDELNYVGSYVTIMQYRYKMQLVIETQISARLRDFAILKFTIQPIVENCIIHAFDPEMTERRIMIRTYEEEDRLRIEISDNGKGMDAGQLDALGAKVSPALAAPRSGRKGNLHIGGMGLRNINERLKLHFGEPYGLEFVSELGEGTTVIMSIPYVELDE
ncbi:cache domain-containing sensor histidine kinase [Paenibacillus pinistramenti]|uniref:cache domain-containing sensor histidine kinase n=1 Tax=Paenibacillus pinistramenti TaxID=1768003 RepID=UPI001108BC3B|nr:sensor histidine kinase [Paenibacillus pinistramenti]